ncbi:MAG: hypothetical protein ACHQIO_17610, partial [Nevskiales bacterium]
TMDDPQKSRVVGKVAWAVQPGGKQPMVTDVYCLPRAGTKDKDMLFRMMATALSEANQRNALDMALPYRKSILADPSLTAKYRYYPAAAEALAVAELPPHLPEFNEALEPACRRIVAAITGEMEIKPALELAAKEVEAVIEKHGYYK